MGLEAEYNTTPWMWSSSSSIKYRLALTSRGVPATGPSVLCFFRPADRSRFFSWPCRFVDFLGARPTQYGCRSLHHVDDQHRGLGIVSVSEPEQWHLDLERNRAFSEPSKLLSQTDQADMIGRQLHVCAFSLAAVDSGAVASSGSRAHPATSLRVEMYVGRAAGSTAVYIPRMAGDESTSEGESDEVDVAAVIKFVRAALVRAAEQYAMQQLWAATYAGELGHQLPVLAPRGHGGLASPASTATPYPS